MKTKQKPRNMVSGGWAIRLANKWLASHSMPARADTDDLGLPDGSVLLYTRPATFCAAAWFGSRGIRESLCEVRSRRWRVDRVIVRALQRHSPRTIEKRTEFVRRSAEASVRRSAVWALRSDGEKALPLIRKALADPSADVRYETVWTLSQIGGKKALALIRKALADPDPDVRRAAGVALEREERREPAAAHA